MAEVFPLATFHLFEPLAEIEPSYREVLDWLSRRRDLSIAVHPVALDSADGEARLGVSVDPVGSSLLVGEPIEGFPSVVTVPARTLDAYRRERDLPAPDLLKIDTQGLELRVLQGAEEALERVEVVFVEAWLERGYGPSTPLLHEPVPVAAIRPPGAIADRSGHDRDVLDECRCRRPARRIAQEVVR